MKANPWLAVDLAEYESHMALPEVGQAAMLAGEFRRAVEMSGARSVGLVGCAGGNGLDEIARLDLARVVCVDVNPAYVHRLSQRYLGKIRGLEVLCTEVEKLSLTEPLDLFFGALVFEYTRLHEAIRSLSFAIRPGGALCALVQRKSVGLPTVSASPYARSLAGVGASFTYIDLEEMAATAKACGLHEGARRVVTLHSGKSFTVTRFEKVSHAISSTASTPREPPVVVPASAKTAVG